MDHLESLNMVENKSTSSFFCQIVAQWLQRSYCKKRFTSELNLILLSFYTYLLNTKNRTKIKINFNDFIIKQLLINCLYVFQNCQTTQRWEFNCPILISCQKWRFMNFTIMKILKGRRRIHEPSPIFEGLKI